MPTSTYSQIPAVVRFLRKVMPTSILDVGIGNGKMGFIARDVLDVMLGQKYRKEDWSVRIDGIEIFTDYIQGHQKAIYDEIFIGDAFEIIDTLGNYELIILGDIIEHFEKHKAHRFMDKCFSHCKDSIIICIPLGEKWTQPPVFDNQHEEHLSFWSYEEFEPFITEKELLDFPGLGDYGCFLIRRDDYTHHRIREEADALFSAGKKDEAITYMEKSLAELPHDRRSEYVLVDLLLRSDQIEEALGRLNLLAKMFPEDKSVKHYLEAVTEKTGFGKPVNRGV